MVQQQVKPVVTVVDLAVRDSLYGVPGFCLRLLEQTRSPESLSERSVEREAPEQLGLYWCSGTLRTVGGVHLLYPQCSLAVLCCPLASRVVSVLSANNMVVYCPSCLKFASWVTQLVVTQGDLLLVRWHLSYHLGW